MSDCYKSNGGEEVSESDGGGDVCQDGGTDAPAVNEGPSVGDGSGSVEGVVKTTGPKTSKNKGKKKIAPKKKPKKTLRDDELELNRAFAEKITMRVDNSFTCKDCPKFVTSVRLLARTHAQSCSSQKKKKVGIRSKKWSCPECEASYKNKQGLNKHYKTYHTISKYVCSHCQKKFKSRGNYVKHLRMHDEVAAIKCFFCPKTFRLNCYRSRHIKRMHEKSIVEARDATKDPSDDEEIVLQVSQTEEKLEDNFYWEYKLTVPSSRKSRNTSHQSFFNTLDLISEEDWTDWIQISKMLSLPLAADGECACFEMAVKVSSNGEEQIICVGSERTPELEKIIEGVLLSLESEPGGVSIDSGDEIDEVGNSKEDQDGDRVEEDGQVDDKGEDEEDGQVGEGVEDNQTVDDDVREDTSVKEARIIYCPRLEGHMRKHLRDS